MKKILFIIFYLLPAVFLNAQDLINKPEKKVEFAVLAGSGFYLNKNYAVKAGEFYNNGSPAPPTYPFFGDNEKSQSLQYKNALGNITTILPQIELSILYKKRNIYAVGGGYVEVGVPDGKKVSGPFYEDFMSMQEVMSFFQYKYKLFFNSRYSFIKNIYSGAIVTYEYKILDFHSDRNSGFPYSVGLYDEKNHLWLLQAVAGWSSSGKIMFDAGLQMNIIGFTSADYNYHYEYHTWTAIETYDISDKYSKGFFFENLFYTTSLKIGFRF